MITLYLLPSLYLALQQCMQLSLFLYLHLNCNAEVGFNLVCETYSVFQNCLALAFANSQVDRKGLSLLVAQSDELCQLFAVLLDFCMCLCGFEMLDVLGQVFCHYFLHWWGDWLFLYFLLWFSLMTFLNNSLLHLFILLDQCNMLLLLHFLHFLLHLNNLLLLLLYFPLLHLLRMLGLRSVGHVVLSGMIIHLINLLPNLNNLIHPAMFLQTDDPFEFILMHKMAKAPPKAFQKNIKLNLNRLPPDFFPNRRQKRIRSHTERVVLPHQNQFILCHKTLDLQRSRRVSSITKEHCSPLPMTKRESTCSIRKIDTHRAATQVKQEQFQGFKCTFAKKLYSDCLQLKKLQFPILDSSRRAKGKMHVQTMA